MNEFLKLKWRTEDLNELEPQNDFIKEDVVSESVIFKYLEQKNYFKKRKNLRRIFSNEPYIPGESVFKPTTLKSTLDTWQQEHCLNAMKILSSGRDPSSYTTQEKFCINIYNELKPKILEENGQYQDYAKRGYPHYHHSLINMRAQVYLFGKMAWEKNVARVQCYPQFFRELKCFNMNFVEQEGNVEFKHTLNPLELGTVARFTQPLVKSKCILTCTTLPLAEKDVLFNSKLVVSEDANVRKIIETNNIDIAISLSGLKCLTDNSDPLQKWFIPVIVKEIEINQNSRLIKKKVVFIDKPFPKTVINKLDIACKSFKRLIKTNFCQYEGVVYPDQDTLIEGKEPLENEKEFVHRSKRTHNIIHHNASYRIWNVKKVDNQNNLVKNRAKNSEINVLVRSKLDGCETALDGQTLHPVLLHPKLERQLQLGANIASQSELAREWTSLYFAPFSNLYRVRIKSSGNEVICIEKCTLQKVVAEAQVHYDYKPHLGLGILQTVFSELRGLETGNYLLQHLKKHEAFVSILKECGKSDKECFDLHAEYDDTSEVDLPTDWLPIDVNFILPAFNHHKRLPGMFTPLNKKQWQQLKKNKKPALKGNQKNNKQQKKNQKAKDQDNSKQ